MYMLIRPTAVLCCLQSVLISIDDFIKTISNVSIVEILNNGINHLHHTTITTASSLASSVRRISKQFFKFVIRLSILNAFHDDDEHHVDLVINLRPII